VSTDQAELYRRHGVPKERITVLPNLGIRAGADELRAASGETPEEWRSATAFVGRLSKAKGGQVIGRLAASLPPESRLRVFGEGYMAAGLAARAPGGTIFCGHVSQRQVLGVMMWARSAVFPSLWPEPGGIVGIDAQVIGVPVTAFEVGAARYWPGARRFPLGEVDAMAGWLGERRPRDAPRDPDAVAAAQAGYWSRVGRRGAEALGAFAADGRFGSFDGAPAEELIR
jgi:glycosyltransferase involved in cell wall biosynthesis